MILREINFGDARSAKSASFTHLEALNFGFYEFFCTLRRIQFTKPTKSRASKMAKTAVLELFDSLKLISRKI